MLRAHKGYSDLERLDTLAYEKMPSLDVFNPSVVLRSAGFSMQNSLPARKAA